MNALAIPQAEGDWQLRGVDADQIFASQQLSDTAMTAAVRVTARFDASFPGWQLYRRVVAGVGLFDRHLEGWATSSARMLATSHQYKGRHYLKPSSYREDWVDQAGRDALDFAIGRRFAAGLSDRAETFAVSPKTYQKIRDPVAGALCIGLQTFQAELHAEYFRVRREDNGIGHYRAI